MAKKQQQKTEPKIYIGKTLKGLPQYRVFSGDLPPHVVELAKNEAVRGLIVPISELAEARRNMRTRGHILNFYANQL